MDNEQKISDEEKGWVKKLASGTSAEDVAEEIGMKPGTFAYKLSLLRAKVGCDNMAALIAFFYKNNLIE